MGNNTKNIKLVNIEEELQRSYLDYAMSVLVGRALPDVRDGLKPVHRRILFAMNVLNNVWNKPYKKSARIVGDVIGKYHPHGDTAVYDAIVRMAQSFSMRYALIDGQGNFGSVDGDSAAAMRYTEIRMSKIACDLLIDLDKETVDYTPNYDNSEYIPMILPTKIPNILVNGSSGIAVGMATNIPPHNITEIINGCLAYIKNKNISIKDLMKYIPGPDFPTAGIVSSQNSIEKAYSTGHGKIFIRAQAKIEIDDQTGRESIIINQIPYQVNKARLIEKIVYLTREKRIEGISCLRDESDKDGMRIVVEIKKSSIGNVVLNKLYSLTQLQISFGINMVALCNGQPKLMSLKDILSSFIQHRCEIVTRRTIFELRKAKERISILEALSIGINNVNFIVSLIKQSKTLLESKEKLMSIPWLLNITDIEFFNASQYQLKNNLKQELKKSYYYLNNTQAQAILDLRLQKLASLEYDKIVYEYKNVIAKINKCSNILKYSDHLMKVIIEELVSVREQYKDTRRTHISNNTWNINMEDLINQENVVVTLSHQGYVKYQPLTVYEAQRRGGKGKSAANIKEEDFINRLLIANTHDNIMLFSTFGKIYWMKIYQLPEASRHSRGKPIVNLLPLELNERITAILPMGNKRSQEECNIFMATASGIVKKTSINEFNHSRYTGIIALNLNKGDELIGVDLTNGNNEVMLFSSYGKVVRFPESQVRNMGRSAMGVKGIQLLKGDKLVSLIIPKGEESILTITQHGYGKRTLQKEYPLKSRSTQGVISIKISKRNGKVVGAIQVNESDQIMIITNSGMLVRIRVSEVKIVGRNTQGVILIKTSNNNFVVGLQRVIDNIISK